jgi:hypothetical protein
MTRSAIMTITCELLPGTGVLRVQPHGTLAVGDFELLNQAVDAYTAAHGHLPGLMIKAPSFPMWSDLDAMLAHMRFIKDHIQHIDKVAIVADGAMADVMPGLANRFVRAQVQHFAFAHEDQALLWLDVR